MTIEVKSIFLVIYSYVYTNYNTFLHSTHKQIIDKKMLFTLLFYVSLVPCPASPMGMVATLVTLLLSSSTSLLKNGK